MSNEPRRADAESRRALLARVLAVQAERPLRELASTGQKRLWLVQRTVPGSPAYNCPLTIEVRGALAPEALDAALQALVARHEALRTTFEEEDGELYQVVAPKAALEVERYSPAGLDLESRRASARAFAEAFAGRIFDLRRGPLYRVALVSVAPDEHLVLLSAHHIVSDGWSQGILLREWLSLYRAAVSGEALELPPLAVQYADVARWERQREPSAEALAYWKRALEGIEALRLPLDRPRPPLPTAAGTRLDVQLSAEASTAARAVARREGASLFQVVLAAFQMLLGRWCGQERFVVGTPSHHRHRAELEGTVGFFVSTVPVPVDLSGEPTVGEAFERLRASALAALAHDDVPFDRLVRIAPPEAREPGAPPLVQALFVWQQDVLPELDLEGARLRAREEPTGTSKFDLTLSLRPEGDAILGHVELPTDLFDETSIRRLLARLDSMLAAMHRAPETPLHSALPADPAPALSGLALAGASDTAAAYARVVSGRGDELAIRTDRRALRFAELDAAASALAARLRSLGQSEGEPVALALPASAEALVGIVAAWKRASPYVPLDPEWPERRRRRVLAETRARVCLGGRGELEAAVPLRVDLDELLRPDLPRESEGVLGARPEDLAYILYTSGSTGEPKGVRVPHRAVAHLDAALDASVYRPLSGRALRVGVFGSLAFDTTVKQIVRLLRGDCLCPVPPELKAAPGELARWLSGAALDVVDLTPSWMRVLIDAGLDPMPRACLLGGEPIDGALWRELGRRQARGEARFVNLYGPTEATVDATWAEIDPHRAPSLGRPLPDTRVWLLDEHLRPVPRGFSGEIAIGGGGVALGYLDRPEATAAAFVEVTVAGRAERVYRTGDFARLRGDGELVFLGRRDRQVKRHGHRIELDEIERALRAHPAVSEAAVVLSGGRIVAWVAARGGPLSPEELAEHASRILPRGFLPDAYRARPSLPRTTSGKIDYVALAAEAAPAPKEPAASFDADTDERARAVVEIWTELLGAPPSSVHADFFEAGGDSLLGLRLLARIEKRFGVPLDVTVLASRPTPSRLAAALRGEVPGGSAELVWLARGDPVASPLALIPGTTGDVTPYRGLARRLDPRRSVVALPAPAELPETLSELAAAHARALLELVDERPRRELLLGGWSLGGVVALETARELRSRGVTVPLVLLLDSRLPAVRDSTSLFPALAGPELESAALGRLSARAEHRLALWRRHELAPYDGDVLLLRASRTAGADPEADRWRTLAPRLVVVRRAMDHHAMMREPDVDEVARVVQRFTSGLGFEASSPSSAFRGASP